MLTTIRNMLKEKGQGIVAICGLRRTVLRSKTDAMRSERTDLI